MDTGLFITLEGIDGVGKSEQANRLTDILSKDFDVYRTQEPFNTEIRKLILDSAWGSPEETTLLFMADRARHVQRCILPALERGAIVICDRYHDSTLAYQCAGKGVSYTAVNTVFQKMCGGLIPNLTLWIDLDPKYSLLRAKKTNGGDRIEEEPEEYFIEALNYYVWAQRQWPKRIKRIEGNQNIEAVTQSCLAAIQAKLEDRGKL